MNNLDLNHFDYSFNNFKTISVVNYWTLVSTSIILEKDNLYFFIQDNREKVSDVSKMPTYIKEDWVNYNKKDLSLDIINRHIKYHCEDEDLHNLLMTIRRDFILKDYCK